LRLLASSKRRPFCRGGQKESMVFCKNCFKCRLSAIHCLGYFDLNPVELDLMGLAQILHEASVSSQILK